MVYGKMCFFIILTPIIYYITFGICYAWGVKADVICLADVNDSFMFGRCYSQEIDVIPLLFSWQMLWPFVLWQMLLPLFNYWQIFFVTIYCNYVIGWCCCHAADVITTCCCCSYKLMADVVAMWQMEKPLFCVRLMLLPSGRWNSHCRVWASLVDVVPGGQMAGLYYFSLSSEVLCKTSSHIWGRWYMPMFLFRDGLFTLRYNASLIHLQRFWSSLPIMLKLSKVTLWHVVL